MLQVYADKNGSDLGQKPDPDMRIKMGAGRSRPDPCVDKSRPAGIELACRSGYSKGGGNHGKHGYVESVKHITAASNIIVQVFQYNFGTHFHDKPLMNHPFPQFHCFDIIPFILFLCALQKSPIIPRNGQPGSKSHKKMLIFSRFFARDIKI